MNGLILQGSAPFPNTIARLLGLGSDPLGQFVAAFIGAAIIGTLMLTMTAVAGPWAKRKITAAFTDRGDGDPVR